MKAEIIILLFLAFNASAIPLLEDGIPDGVPSDAVINESADSVAAPQEQVFETEVFVGRAIPNKVFVGETFNITLRVSNKHHEALTLLLVEPQRQGITYVEGPQPHMVRYDGLEIPLYRWKSELQPGESREYSYTIRADNPGIITFPPASVNDDYGNVFETPSANIIVECNPNGACDPGENYILCPSDCPTSSADGVCDGVEDGRPDPDCMPEADPDYQKLAHKSYSEVSSEPGMCNGLIPALLALTAMLIRFTLEK